MRALLLMGVAMLAAACSTGPRPAERRLVTDPAVAARAQASLEAGAMRDMTSAMALDGGRANRGQPLPPIMLQRVARNAAIEAELQRIFERVAAGWTATPRVPARIVLAADRGFSASATPDRVILVNLGVIEQAETEDELAFVIAHEYAHLLLGHHRERARNTAALRLVTAGSLRATSLGLEVAQRTGTTQGTMGNVAVGAILAANLALALTDEVAESSWARDQEVEADRLGFDLLAQAGYSAGAAAPVFRRIAETEKTREQRQAALRQTFTGAGGFAANQLGQRVGGWGGLAIMAGGLVLGEALDNALGSALGGLTESHGSADARQADLNAYADAHWGDAPTRAQPNPFRARRLQEQVAQLVAVERALMDARIATNEGRLDDAARLLAPAGRRPTEIQRLAPVGWHQERARLAVARGDHAAAIQELSAAEAMPDAPATVYTELAQSFLTGNRPGDALATLDRAERRFGSADPFIADRLRVLHALRREADFNATMERCRNSMASEFARRCDDTRRGLGAFPRPQGA